jgi:hypothetical protein
MKRRSRREKVEGVQYAAFWLADEIHNVPREAAFATLLHEVSDEAIDFVASCSSAGRQIAAVLTGALATKLYGDPDKEYAFEWTNRQELDAELVLASALQLECLRRAGMVEVVSLPTDPWARGAVFECRLTRKRNGRGYRFNAWDLMKTFLPDAWRAPEDFVIPEADDRRMDRHMSRRRQSTWPRSTGSLFPSGGATGRVC